MTVARYWVAQHTPLCVGELGVHQVKEEKLDSNSYNLTKKSNFQWGKQLRVIRLSSLI